VCDRNATGIGNVLASKWNVNNESEYLQTLDGDLRMKKSLFALAALGAFAGAAQAQSSVTLYGTIDMALTYINNSGATNGAATTSYTGSTQPTTGNALALTDFGVYSNVWGLKGEEDLGGGMKAIFNLESDLLGLSGSIYNNSTSGYNQLFRRAANVGLTGNFGTVRLGQQGNPLVAASANLLPVEGNSVNQVRTAIGYSIGDFMANAVSYETPKLGGLTAKVAYSLSNQVDDSSGGSAVAANAFYVMGPVDFTLGYNQQTSISNVAGATATAATTGTANSNMIACTNTISSTVAPCDLSSNAVVNNTKFMGNLKGYVAGMKYKITPTLQVGYAYGHSDYDSGMSVAQVSGQPAKAYNGAVQMLGVGYQATPALLLGANYLVSNLDSTLTNLQARYSLSKRTMLYTQISMAKNGAGTYQVNTTNGAAFGNFLPVQTNTSGAPVGVAGSGALPNTTQTAYGVGIVHMF